MPGIRTTPKEVASAYLAAASRLASWMLISALVYRRTGAGPFALLALVRATLGVLNYTTIGLAPAMLHYLPRGATDQKDDFAAEGTGPRAVLPLSALYSNGLALAWSAAGLGLVVLLLYELWFERAHGPVPGVNSSAIPWFLTLMGLGTILRLASDPSGALLQVRGHIPADNLLLALSECAWVVIAATGTTSLWRVGVAFGLASLGLFCARSVWGYRMSGVLLPAWREVRAPLVRMLLAFGLLVSLAQAADFLYAPTDYILIDRLLSPIDLATYAPAVQLDGGLLLLVTALAGVILPKAALAHAANDHHALRAYYLRGTSASAILLGLGAATVWLVSPWIFRLWLGDPMPATVAILPLVFVSTVIGGSSAVGRSIFLGAGRVKPFTISVLLAGATNVVFSYALVRYAHLGLRGIIAGTIIAVVARCGIWMPWYLTTLLGQRTEVPA